MQDYTPIYEAIDIEQAIALVAPSIVGVHAACRAVTPISRRDFDNLVESIRKDDLLHPILVNSNNEALDGRSRIQALAALGRKLKPEDIVTTDADPFAIARSNSARRHLSQNARRIEAGRLLVAEKQLSSKKKAEGAARRREARQNLDGTNSVPSKESPNKRQPRSSELIAKETGFSRQAVETFAKLVEREPALAAKVEADEIPYEEARERAGLAPRKRSKPKQSKPSANSSTAVAQTESANAEATQVWSDKATKITDLANGIRVHQCKHATFFAHKTESLSAIVMRSGREWWWHVGSEESEGVLPERLDAEKAVLKRLIKLLGAVGEHREPASTTPTKPR